MGKPSWAFGGREGLNIAGMAELRLRTVRTIAVRQGKETKYELVTTHTIAIPPVEFILSQSRKRAKRNVGGAK